MSSSETAGPGRPPEALSELPNMEQASGDMIATEHVQTPHTLPMLEHSDPMFQAANPPVAMPATGINLTSASNLLSSITASTLLPSSVQSQLPDLSLLPPLTVSSLLFAASNDIISSITSTLPQSGLTETSDPVPLSTASNMPSLAATETSDLMDIDQSAPSQISEISSLSNQDIHTNNTVSKTGVYSQPHIGNDLPSHATSHTTVSQSTNGTFHIVQSTPVSVASVPRVSAIAQVLKPVSTSGPPLQPAAVLSTSGPPLQPAAVLSTSGPPLQPAAVLSTSGPPLQPATVFSTSGPTLQPAAVLSTSGPPLQPAAVLSTSGPPLQPAAVLSTSGPALQPAAVLSTSGPALQPAAVLSTSGPTLQLDAVLSTSGPTLQPTTIISSTGPGVQPNVVTSTTGLESQPNILHSTDILSALANTAFANIDKLTQETLLTLQQSSSGSRGKRVSTPSLHANEQLLSDDSDIEEEMDIKENDVVPTETAMPLPPPSGGASRSDSVSPYADDDSFASFLAREVNETASALDDDRSSVSRSPTPGGSSQTSSSDVHTLVSYLQNSRGQSSGGPSAVLKRFGVTASCPPAPVQLPEGALTASLDMTTGNFPKRSKYAHRAAMSAMHPYNRTRGGGASVAKTLDLLKAVLQSSFNMEVKRLCDDYLHIFSLAATNIRENTGDTVPDATLRLLVCKMIEEAQQGYVQGKWEFPYGKLPRNEKVTPASGSPMSTKKLKTDRGETRYGPPKRVRKPPAERHSEKSAVWKWGMDKRRLDPEKWEPEKMTLNTVFCLGVNVNKALGHAANRGKVYYLHPELFKYACDGDDKTWLYENKYLPVHGGKAFLMIYNEVGSLVATEDLYKDSPEVINSVHKLQQFRVPQFMIDKMKTFMKSVQGYFAQEANAAGINSNGASKS